MSKLTKEEADLEASLSSAPTEVAEFAEQDGGLIRKAQHVLHQNPALVPLIVLIVSVIIFGAILGSKFFSPFALTLILQQVQIVAILGAAQSLVILTAGIDLSVGAIMVLSSVVMGQFTFRYGIPVELGIICGLICGTACGFINGWLVAVMRLPPFIVTLGMWQILLATTFIYSANESIRAQDIEEQAVLLHYFGTKIPFAGVNFTYGALFAVILAFGLAYTLRTTALSLIHISEPTRPY